MTIKKPSLGILADFSYDDPIKLYTKNLAKVLDDDFDIKWLDLKSSELIFKKTNSDYLAELNFKDLYKKVEDLDVLNLHMELGLYGNTCEIVLERLVKFCTLAKSIIITVHSLHVSHPDFANLYQKLFHKVRCLSTEKNILFLVSNRKDKNLIQGQFRFANCAIFPVVFHTKEDLKSYTSQNIIHDTDIFKSRVHFPIDKNDIIIGCFGYYHPLKDFITVLKCLPWLPENYKLFFCSQQQPGNRVNMEKDPVVTELVDFIDNHDKNLIKNAQNLSLLSNRVAFVAPLPDEQFVSLIAAVDFVAVNYLEAGMSASSIIAQALQLNKKIIATNASLFTYICDFFPECFEQIDFGNYFQMRQKILKYSPEKLQNLQNISQKWSIETLSQLYLDFYNNKYGKLTAEKANYKEIFSLKSIAEKKNISPHIKNLSAGMQLGESTTILKGNGTAKGKAPNASLKLTEQEKSLQFFCNDSCVAGRAMHLSLRYQYPGNIAELRNEVIMAKFAFKANKLFFIDGMYLKIHDGISETYIPVKQLDMDLQQIDIFHTIHEKSDKLVCDFVLAEGESANLKKGLIIELTDLNIYLI